MYDINHDYAYTSKPTSYVCTQSNSAYYHSLNVSEVHMITISTILIQDSLILRVLWRSCPLRGNLRESLLVP